jgi:hypothetical protein
VVLFAEKYFVVDLSKSFITKLAEMEVQSDISKLNPFELEAVLKWVDSFELSRSRRKLNRDFSDGVLLAEILKFEFPNLVQLHNYSGCSAVQGKIVNWDTLNRKVLRKLQMNLESEEIEKLAKAESNYIEEVLFQVMNQIEVVKTNNESKLIKNKLESSTDVMTIKVWKQIGDRVQEVPQQMIQLAKYEELLEKSRTDEKMLEELKELVDDLQTTLDTKSKIIEDLLMQLEKKSKKASRSLSIGSLRDSIANLF